MTITLKWYSNLKINTILLFIATTIVGSTELNIPPVNLIVETFKAVDWISWMSY